MLIIGVTMVGRLSMWELSIFCKPKIAVRNKASQKKNSGFKKSSEFYSRTMNGDLWE